MYYPIKNPFTDQEVFPRQERVWAYGKPEMERHVAENLLWWGKTGNYTYPKLKRFRSDAPDELVPRTLWRASEVGQTRTARIQLQDIFGGNPFPTPKPLGLLKRIVDLATVEGSLVLDSFAGSGTTAHATLLAGMDRKFILVECEDYADTLTAERLRRAIKGYVYKGTQRETLYEQKLNLASLKKSSQLLQEAANATTFHAGSFDKVETKVEDGTLRVKGIRKVDGMAPGLGGTFTFCTLGEPLELEKLLSGEQLPSRQALAKWLLYVSNQSKEPAIHAKVPEDLVPHFVAKQGNIYTWLLYQPDKDYLTSHSAALTLDLARKITAVNPKAEHRVFSPSKYVSNKVLREEKLNIEHAVIPFALFRKLGG